MANNFVRKAIDKYADLYQGLERIAIEWNPEQQKLVYVEKQRILLYWYFNIGVVIFGTSCYLFLIIRQLFSNEVIVPLWILLMKGNIGLLGALTALLAISMSISGKEIVFAWNNLMVLSKINVKGKL